VAEMGASVTITLAGYFDRLGVWWRRWMGSQMSWRVKVWWWGWYPAHYHFEGFHLSL